MVESVASCRCEVWPFKREEQRKLLALEMNYLRRSARESRLQKIQKKKPIRSKIKAQ